MTWPSGVSGATQKFVRLREALDSLPADHPLRISLRTYVLGASLSLGPALLSVLRARIKSSRNPGLHAVLVKHLGPTGFPFAMTLAVGGGALLRRITESCIEGDSSQTPTKYPRLREFVGCMRRLSAAQRDLLFNFITSLATIVLLQAGHKSRRLRRRMTDIELPMTVPEGTFDRRLSPTLDLTLMFCVRAGDVLLQRLLSLAYDQITPKDMKISAPAEDGEAHKSVHKTNWMHRITGHIDAFAFWLSSYRIMWCFFYAPSRLPRSYLNWINALADIDPRLVGALRAVRNGTFSYEKGLVPPSDPDMVSGLAVHLGCPPEWGDPKLLSAFSGDGTAARNSALGFSRDVGGLPCEIVHGGVDMHSCTANSLRRGGRVFLKATLIYLPVHFLPLILSRPKAVLQLSQTLPRLLSLLRSSAFLSSFVSSIWIAVCLTRTLLIPRLFPWISHDLLDGSFGCVLAGCLACGSSIRIESARRRGEMALYVLPRAIRASLPISWLSSRGTGARAAERLLFALSLSFLLSAGTHYPESLRGLTRATLALIMKGDFSKKDRSKTPVVPDGVEGNGKTDSTEIASHIP